MGVGIVFLNFLQRIAAGAAVVFVLFFLVRISLPRRATIVLTRRTID
jgi:hypothetical protein